MPKSKSKRKTHHPPPKAKPKQSPPWVGVLFFTLMGLGIATIIAGYLGFLPDSMQSWELYLGLGFITAAFVVAMQWH
jgi:Cell division protein CrgA